jgi:hypothetical protein
LSEYELKKGFLNIYFNIICKPEEEHQNSQQHPKRQPKRPPWPKRKKKRRQPKRVSKYSRKNQELGEGKLPPIKITSHSSKKRSR